MKMKFLEPFWEPGGLGRGPKTIGWEIILEKKREKRRTEAAHEKNTKVCRNLVPKWEASGRDNMAPVRYLLRFTRFRFFLNFHEK